ncbi:MAG: hypothetical protein LBC74_10380, partial [Planctomycetaceae bacterium]|nr:hypothetical protein [Planctomycetaceae bacterium]
PAFFLAVPYKINDQTDKNIVIRQKIEWVFRFLSRKLNLLETKLLAKNDLLLYPILPDNNNSNNSEEQNSDEQNNVPTIEYIDEEVQYENVDDVEDEVSGNSKNNVFDENLFKNYIDKFSATKNPYLVNAFKCSEGDFIKVVFLFGKPVKTFLLQLSAKEDENKQVTNIIRYITGQINYLSIGVDPLKSRLRAVAQAKNAASAKQVQNGLSGLTDWGVTFIDGSAAMFIAFSALPEEILPVISLVLEILRGVANYAIPACDKDNLKWNYEINPEKTSAEIAAGVVALACMLCIGTEESCTKLFAEWKEKMRPLLRIKNEIKRVTE